jgi:ATP-dependent DNA helicase RecQ
MVANKDASQTPTPDGILINLELDPTVVSGLPSKARTSLLSYLVRWQHYDAALQCLEQLLVTDGHLVSIYDGLAKVYLALDQPARALEVMAQRHALRVSNSSRALEARAHQAAGHGAAARAIAHQLVANRPDLLTVWGLQAELCQADGDWKGAEAAWDLCDALHSGTAATAWGLARLWQARGDLEKALLWARTALSRTERDERRPSPDLLRLLEDLYRATNQPAQAEATAVRRQDQEKQERDALRQMLSVALPTTPRPDRVPATKSVPLPPPPELSSEEHTRLQDALHRHFPHAGFRPGQAEIIAAVLRGESVLAVMPTGAGKSLCYQLAALLLPGTTLVISPLIALMKDQLDGLPDGVAARATTLNSTLDGSELDARLARAASGGYQLLYAAPERLRQRPFLHALKRAGISLMVVDEAHCVSLWGHDFRPDYRFIAKAWQELDSPRILAMTATATPRVQDDIQAALGHMLIVATDIHRPNLCLEARYFTREAEKKQALLSLCREIQGSGIVYANSRLKCEELAALLRDHGVSAIHYHAGIDDRAAAQDRFMNSQVRVVVATVAFGMGVDKADVRFIIHFHPPRALENYYQEAGRAGRDGLPARCILFHAPSDKSNLRRWNRLDALHLDFLRGVYSAVQRRLGGRKVGLVSAADLERDLQADSTQVRVAIHFLEGAGLIWRGFDLPRTAALTLNGAGGSRAAASPANGSRLAGENGMPGAEPGLQDYVALARFVEAARLVAGQPVSRDLLALSRDAGLDPREVEARLLTWNDAGWLSYRGIGRDMLLALTVPPDDSPERVAAMLADYRAGQDSRIAEIMAYSATRLCRHGYISSYFGGRPIEQCTSCDNCLKTATGRRAPGATPTRVQPEATLPDSPAAHAAASQPPGQIDPSYVILQAIAQLPFGVGRTGLGRILQGAESSPIQADRFPLFGALSNMTQTRIRKLAGQLLEGGFLEAYHKGRYQLLRLTEKGKNCLDAPPRAAGDTILPPPPPEPPGPKVDEDLLQRLYEWRRAIAREIEKPAYVIFHNATLERVAASRPATLEELAAIKGIGPKKLERYGQAVLDVISQRESHSTSDQG